MSQASLPYFPQSRTHDLAKEIIFYKNCMDWLHSLKKDRLFLRKEESFFRYLRSKHQKYVVYSELTYTLVWLDDIVDDIG